MDMSSKSFVTSRVSSIELTWCAPTVKAPFQGCQLFDFADAIWADNKSSYRSTLCYVFCCNGAALSWKSDLAPILAVSTCKAELIIVARGLLCSRSELLSQTRHGVGAAGLHPAWPDTDR